jgi:Kef-type K+ transport system membrane component KefB
MKEILSKHRQDAAIALLIYLLSLGLGLVAMTILGYPHFLALIISATGVGVVIPVIREMGHGETRFGKMILLASLISEFATLLIVVVFEVIHTHGISARLLNVVYVGIFFYVTLTVLRAVIWWFPEKFQILFEEHDPSETGMRFSLFLVAMFVGVSMMLGLEHIVGSFLAGITLGALFPSRQVLDSKFLGIGFGFFIPIFFIFVGLRFELPNLTDWAVLKPFLILLVASYIVRALASSCLLFVGFGPRETVAGGLLVAAQLSLNIVAGTIALNAGIIDQGLYDSVIMLALVTSFLFPTIAKWILSRRSEDGRPGSKIVDDGIDLDTIAQWSPYEESAHDH